MGKWLLAHSSESGTAAPVERASVGTVETDAHPQMEPVLCCERLAQQVLSRRA